MASRTLLGIVCGLLIGSMGCAAGEPPAPTGGEGDGAIGDAPAVATAAQALSFSTAARDRVQGTFVHQALTVQFDVQVNATARLVRLSIGEVSLAVDLDLTTLEAVIDGQNSGLEPAHKDALAALQKSIEGLDEETAIPLVGDDPDTSALGTLLRHASYFSKSPVQRPVVRRTVKLSRGQLEPLDHERANGEGITYLNQCKRSAWQGGKSAVANWTQADGSWRSQAAACGSAAGSCEGRCGAGCPCNSWYCANRYYTKDCFDHDVCLNNNPGDTSWSPFASNCGDEFDDAFDDFTFGSSSGW